MLLPLVPLACRGDDGAPTGPNGGGEPAAVAASHAALDFTALGDSTRLTAEVRDAAGNTLDGVAVTWASTDEGVALVRASGWVVAVSNGQAAVVAKAGELTDTVAVAVQQVAAQLEVSPAAVVLGQGREAELSVVGALDANGHALDEGALAGLAVEWASADETLATVDETGRVTAVGWGAETIVTASAGQVSGQAAVSVLHQIAFVCALPGKLDICVMNADGSDLVNLTDAEGIDENAAWSPDGMRIAFRSSRSGGSDIYLMNADGSGLIRLTDDPGFDGAPIWSPDGTKIAFSTNRDGDNEIYVMNADGSGETNLTNHPATDVWPAWSPDGTRIAFQSDRDGNKEIYVMAANGGGPVNLTENDAIDANPVWLADGDRIAFESDRASLGDIYVMAVDGSEPVNLSQDPEFAFAPAWSPDGSRIVYVSSRNGNWDIYVMDADGSGQTPLAPDPATDFEPSWSPDGAFIVFTSQRDGYSHIHVVNADGSGLLNVSQAAGLILGRSAVWRPRP